MKKLFTIFVSGIILFTACKKEQTVITVEKIEKASLSGVVQKGPFLNGAGITLYELDDKFESTGKSFITQVTDNSGAFSFGKVTLQSRYAVLKADGYFFNEVSGTNSASQISLTGIFDVKDIDKCHVNILTHITKARIEALLASGKSFSEARDTAYNELYKIFNSTAPESISDTLSIASTGNENAFLLAISTIFVGFRTDSELSELMADFISDFKMDGIVDNASVGTRLVNDSKLINLNTVRANMQSRYESLGVAYTFPDFESVLSNFNQQTAFVYSKQIEYPSQGEYGINLLADTIQSYLEGCSYSLAANLPKGTKLRIEVAWSDGIPFASAAFEKSGWDVSLDLGKSPKILTANSGMLNDIFICLSSPANSGTTSSDNSIKISIYENDATTPTRIKTITVIANNSK